MQLDSQVPRSLGLLRSLDPVFVQCPVYTLFTYQLEYTLNNNSQLIGLDGLRPDLHVSFADMKYCVWPCSIAILAYTSGEMDLQPNNVSCERERPQPAASPAVDHNGFVSSSSLYHQHILNDCHDGRRRGAQTLRSPAGHLELSDLVVLARLQERNSSWHTVHTYSGSILS